MRYGTKRVDLSDRNRVIASYYHFTTQLADVLYKVVGERVVIVEDENHGMKFRVSSFEFQVKTGIRSARSTISRHYQPASESIKPLSIRSTSCVWISSCCAISGAK